MRCAINILAKKSNPAILKIREINNKHMDELASEIYELVKTKMEEQGAFDRDSYDQIVEETIDYFREKGKLTDDDNDEFIRDELDEMFETAVDELADRK